jgi:diphosphomevalonate decarboxylase
LELYPFFVPHLIMDFCKQHPVILETVSAPTNIACIKYWGKADVALNTPINSSVSVTLDQDDLRAVTTAATSQGFERDRLWLNGIEDTKASESKRFRACIDGVKKLATDRMSDDGKSVLIRKKDWMDLKIHISSYNTFPTAAGLASSAAGYAALVAALAKLMNAKEEYEGQLSTIARQGSGSACRSLYGGFVAWRMGGEKADWSDSIAQQVADEKHWPELRALIMVVSDAKKDTSSTAGMSTSVATSQLLKFRAASVVDSRMEAIEKAYLAKDFPIFGQITMADSNQFHATCLDTYPPIFYMNDISRSIIRLVHVYNSWVGSVRAAYTFDAGPNAVIYTLEDYYVELGALLLFFFPEYGEKYVNNDEFFRKVKDHALDASLIKAAEKTGAVPASGSVKMIYVTKPGPGPKTLSPLESNLDPATGLNIYKPS